MWGLRPDQRGAKELKRNTGQWLWCPILIPEAAVEAVGGQYRVCYERVKLHNEIWCMYLKMELRTVNHEITGNSQEKVFTQIVCFLDFFKLIFFFKNVESSKNVNNKNKIFLRKIQRANSLHEKCVWPFSVVSGLTITLLFKYTSNFHVKQFHSWIAHPVLASNSLHSSLRNQNGTP